MENARENASAGAYYPTRAQRAFKIERPTGKTKFWAVSLNGPAKLQVEPFSVVEITASPQPGNPGIPCRRVHVELNGVFKRFWDGFYFIRSDDHSFVYYEGYTLGSKRPTGTIDILE